MTITKRKKTVVCLVALFVFSFLCVAYQLNLPAEAQQNRINIGSASGVKGDNVSLKVSANDIEMAGYQFKVIYNPAKLEPQSVTNKHVDGNFNNNIHFAPGEMNFFWARDEDISVNDMFTINFRVIGTYTGSAEVYIDQEDGYNMVLNENSDPVPAVFYSGRVNYREGDECYIATAVYGSSEAGEVVALRNYRDEVLKESLPGRLFIQAYYYLSPPLANYLEEAEILNSWVRSILDGLVNLIISD